MTFPHFLKKNQFWKGTDSQLISETIGLGSYKTDNGSISVFIAGMTADSGNINAKNKNLNFYFLQHTDTFHVSDMVIIAQSHHNLPGGERYVLKIKSFIAEEYGVS